MSDDVSRPELLGVEDASPDVNRVLLLMRGARNRELLRSVLDGYDVVDGDAGGDAEAGTRDGTNGSGDLPEFDLCVVDAATYPDVATRLAARKEAAGERYLPVLLVVRQRDQTAASELLDDVPDDVVSVPAPERVVRSRVESHLRTRRQSLRLDAQREKLSLYRRAIEDTTTGITIAEATDDQPLTYVNDAFLDITGYEREEVLGRNCRFLQGEGTDDDAIRAIHEAIESGESVSVELRNYRKDGTPFWNHLEVSPVFDADGELTHFIGFQSDITERYELREELREETETLESLLETSPVGITVLDREGNIVRANEAAKDVLGLERSNVVGRTFDAPEWEIIDESGDSIDSEDLPFSHVMKTGDPVTGYEHGIRAGDERRWLSINAAPLTDADGDRVGVVATVEDVTDRKEREREREQLIDLFDRSQEIADVGAWEIDVEAETAEFTAGLSRLLDIGSQRDFDLSDAFEFYHPDDVAKVQSTFERLVETGESQSIECRIVTAEGETRWVHVRGVAKGDDSSTYRGTVQDITDRKERERELERYKRIVETTGDPIYTLDGEMRFTLVNDAAADYADTDRAEIPGRHVSAVFGEYHAEALADATTKLLADGTRRTTIETTVTDRSGNERQLQTTIVVKPHEDAFTGVVCVSSDITELRERERRLSVLDRVLRHNLRNKMNIVLAASEMILEDADSEGAHDSAEVIERAADELLAIAETARKFHSTLDPRATERVDVRDVAEHVREVTEEARLSYPSATIRAEIPETAPARVHEAFELAVSELIDNAVTHADSDDVDVSVSVREDADSGDVVVRVADDGPGMSAVEQRSLRTGEESPLQHTSGLGLWFVRWTVTNGGGSLSVRDNEPTGTVVELRLPKS